jgi:hypothetical protein
MDSLPTVVETRQLFKTPDSNVASSGTGLSNYTSPLTQFISRDQQPDCPTTLPRSRNSSAETSNWTVQLVSARSDLNHQSYSRFSGNRTVQLRDIFRDDLKRSFRRPSSSLPHPLATSPANMGHFRPGTPELSGFPFENGNVASSGMSRRESR